MEVIDGLIVGFTNINVHSYYKFVKDMKSKGCTHFRMAIKVYGFKPRLILRAYK